MAKAKHKSPSRHLNHMAGAMCYRLLTEIPDALYMIELTLPMVSRIIGTGLSYNDYNTNFELLELLKIPDPAPKKTEQVRQNLSQLCSIFELDERVAVLLEFILIMNINSNAKFLIDCIELPDQDHDLMLFYEHISGLDKHHIIEAMESLISKGILSADSAPQHLPWLEMSNPIQYLLTKSVVTSCEQILASFLVKSPAPAFTLSDFDYVNIDLLRRYMQKATAAQHTGINVLLYGYAGTGKTELARALASELDRQLFEIGSQVIADGKLQQKHSTKYVNSQRVQYLTTVQTLLRNSTENLLLIDECESIFQNADSSYSKDMLHQTLERNTVPAIWITNHVGCLEDSYLRRFKLVLEINSPDENKLKALTEQAVHGLNLSENAVEKIAAVKHITPAIIGNAAYVTKTVGEKRNKAESTMLEVIENTLEACGLWQNDMRYQQEIPFDVSLLNLKQPKYVIDEINHAVSQGQPVRVLLCGPPGTGKTAYAHYLTKAHDIKLKRVQCSDVLSKYVGESEQNVRQLFISAHRNKHALLLDEVDSLLTSRDRLQAQHETQLVNEILTQLECFTQPLFAATNFETALDKAVLRRFDFKLECDYLHTEQVLMLFRRVLGVSRLTQDEQQQLSTLNRLTPGDFAIIARRMKFQPKQDHRQSALQMLLDENKRKQPNPTIGFVH
ncbi:AAA family ATPase [Alishewanella jeotgali]|uniref:ATPase n=1 Tax=Alishewanella jeotgali KCTC 22429 TaxID=1129374 RepID=H3ZGE5_9ALTE|nr:AAA family ATPase [Alishewanella jeotgali]EHR40465.1 ATPase [Alishewanella jeotgali KCTC 22429]